MKKLFVSILIISPIAVSAQPAASSGSGTVFLNLIVYLAIIVGIFLLCRELICWYWKINKTISNQEEIIRLLRKIANENNETDNNQKIIDPFHK